MDFSDFIIKNSYINTNEKIFDIIADINIEFQKLKDSSIPRKILLIVFSEDIAFIDPLFFSLLLQIHEKYIDNKIVLVIDVLNFIQDEKYREYKNIRDPRQHYIHRILLSAIDMPHFELYHVQSESNIKSFRDNYQIHIEKRIKDKIYKDQNGRVYEKLIVLLYSRKHSDTIFLTEEEDKEYKLLPIVKVTNFPEFIYDNDLSTNEFDTRKSIYESITITNDKIYDPNTLKESFEKNFISLVKSETHTDLNQPLRDIFFEILDNIKCHARYDNGVYSDSYFNFYYDVPTATFKFHIIDNLETGFINTYIETLNNDMRKLEEQGLDVERFYNKALNELSDSNKDIEFLELFFSEYGWFQSNKIPRIVLHFGMPLLVDIIKKTSGTAYIRLHRANKDGDKFYEIKIDAAGASAKEIKDTNKQIKGTYIAVNIPEKHLVSNKNPLRPSSVVRSLGKSDFEKLENEKEVMIELAKKFIKGAQRGEDYAIYDYSNYQAKTISDFIRHIYIDAHKRQITDILVVDINLRENSGYFKTLTYLLYHKEYTKQDDFLPINILFWDKTSFDIFFIGGKDKNEFCKSNQLLYEHYGQKNDYFLDKMCSETEDEPAQSIFFVGKNKNDFIVLPFELLIEDIEKKDNNEAWKKLSYQRVIIRHLNENKVNKIHFDTQRGYHVDGFYKFDTVFQSSQFLERLVYGLSEQISNDLSLKNKKLAFVGFGKYLNLFIALLINRLKAKGKEVYERYNIVNEYDIENEKMEVFIEKMKENAQKDKSDLYFISISSVVFDGDMTSEFLKKYIQTNNYSWYSLIQIILQNNPKVLMPTNITSLIKIEIADNLYYDLKKEPCPVCTEPDNEKPLLKIDQSDGFKLEKTYFREYEEKQFLNTVQVEGAKFYNATAFGHIKRGENNHYLYYTKTVNFFEDNEKKIEIFLKDIGGVENPSNAILLLPMHCTVNRFASMVHTLIFDGKANIFQFDKRKGIKNFHELKNQLDESIDYKFYFVDDEISSGYTLEYFYSLIQYLGKDSFEKIFVLIDRADRIDEKLILNYVKDGKKENVHLFSKMEIKPIKTAIEQCFLCGLRDEYKKRLKSTSLDMNRFAIANRIAKLNIQDSKLYDFEESKSFNIDDFRRYLKMYAVDYIYSHFSDIYLKDIESKTRNDILLHYKKIEKAFIGKVQDKIKALHPFKNKKYENLLDEIGEYEGRIVFLKALSFPKLVYYYSIRHMITVVIIAQIKEYIRNDAIEPIFNQTEIEEFLSEQTEKNYKEFIEHFRNKINMNYLSFLYKTASYLDVHYVIHYDNVEYYFKAAKKIKEHNKDNKDAKKPYLDQSLVEYYQLAAKMVASYSDDRAKYLKANIDKVLTENPDAGYKSLLLALLIENHYEEEINDFKTDIKNIFKPGNSLETAINDLEKKLQTITGDQSLKIYSLYINQYADRTYESYSKYLEEMTLVDIAHGYRRPYQTDEFIEEHLVKGFLSKRIGEKFQDDEFYRERIHNTWSNLLVSRYIVGDGRKTRATLVKLVDINPDNLDTDSKKRVNIKKLVKENNALWYKPIGCIVVTYNSEKKKRHITLSKYLLSIQEEIVSFLKENFSSGVIQEAILRNIARRDYMTVLSQIHHSVKDYIGLNNKIDDFLKEEHTEEQYKEYLEKLSKYTWGLVLLTSISKLKEGQSKKPTNIIGLFYNTDESEKDFITSIRSFISVAHEFSPTLKENVELEISYTSDNNWINITDATLKIIVFEFIFNALKRIGDNDKPLIKIEVNEDSIVFRNECSDGLAEHVKNINNISSKGKGRKGMGILAIKELFNTIDYSLTAKEIGKEICIIISKEKNI